MHVSNYEALSQDGEDVSYDGASSSVRHVDDLGPVTVKPETYYGEGLFDPPSSDDEGDDLLEKRGLSSPGLAERAAANGILQEDGQLIVGIRKRPASLRFLVISLVSLVTMAAVIGIFAARSYTGTPYRIHGTRHITMDHVFNGTFSAKRESILWVPEAGDGVFATTQNGYITLVDLKNNSTRNLIALSDLKDEHGRRLSQSSWKLSADMRYMLLKADYVKRWRHSSFGNYYLHDLQTKNTWPLIPPTYPPVTTYATWSPTGDSIAYVVNNDVYVVPSPSCVFLHRLLRLCSFSLLPKTIIYADSRYFDRQRLHVQWYP